MRWPDKSNSGINTFMLEIRRYLMLRTWTTTSSKKKRKIDQCEIAVHIHSSHHLNLHLPKNRRQIHPLSPTLIKVLIHTSCQWPQQHSICWCSYNSRDDVCQAESQSQFDELTKKDMPTNLYLDWQWNWWPSPHWRGKQNTEVGCTIPHPNTMFEEKIEKSVHVSKITGGEQRDVRQTSNEMRTLHSNFKHLSHTHPSYVCGSCRVVTYHPAFIILSNKLPDFHFKLQLHASQFVWFLAPQAGSSAWVEDRHLYVLV